MTTAQTDLKRYAMIDPIIATGTVDVPDEALELEASPGRPIWGLSRSLLTNVPLILGDLLLLTAGLAFGFAVSLSISRAAHDSDQLINFHSALAGCYLGMACMLGLHQATGMNPVLELRQQLIAMAAAHVLVVLLGSIFGTPAAFELAAVGVSFILACVTLPVCRAFFRKRLAVRSWWGERVVLVGTESSWGTIRQFIDQYPQRGLKLAGTIDLESAGNSSLLVSDERRLSDTELAEHLGSVQPGWVILTATDLAPSAVRRIVSCCVGVRNIVVLNTASAFPTLWTSSYECAGRFGIHLRDSLLSLRMQFLKRLLDIVGTLVFGVLAAPIAVVAAVWIKLTSPGPVFYCQDRVGRGGRTFRAIKFRTMVIDADAVLENHLGSHPHLREEWLRDRKLRDDPRVIDGIGHLLRMTSLDELPQLWNVLIGDMSLVGPRPIVMAEIPRYRNWYPLYQRVRPGLTGLWQVSGRNRTSYDDRVRLDAYYVMNWSPWMDAYILLRTARTVLRCEGAY